MIEIDKDYEKSHPEEKAPPQREPFPIRRKPEPRGPSRLHDVFKSSRNLQFDQGTGFHGGSSRRKGHRMVLWSWLASVIDGLILVSVSCAFILMFSLIVKTQVGLLLSSVFSSRDQLSFFIEIYILSAWIYMITVRSLMGSTIGEWTCDLRLGQPQERMRSNYVLRVALRSTLIVLTGVVTLPLLSLVAGRDLSGALTGLRLFSLK